MAEDKSQVGAPVDEEPRSPEQIRREIEDTREELGDTAAALAEKTDVKTRAREKVEEMKQTVAEKKEAFSASSNPGDPNAAGGTAARASAAASDLKGKAKENPIHSAAMAAFVGGFLLGRITSR